MEKLTDEMLENVTGGSVHQQEEQRGLRYCKYCNQYFPFFQLPDQTGYEGEFAYRCRVYKCMVCKQDTYWRFTDYYLS